jgi:hypothetical protein
MFPIRSGLDANNTLDQDGVLNGSLVASAMHEIGKQAILDTSILLFHQQAAEIYYRTNGDNIVMQSLDAGNLELFSAEESKALRHHLINLVMKFHIFDEDGLAKRLDPVIEFIKTRQPLPEYAIADQFIQSVLLRQQDYNDSVYANDTRSIIERLTDFSIFDNLTEEMITHLIMASYNDPNEPLDVLVYEDDTVQCGCEYCYGFFQVLEKLERGIDHYSLNRIQQIMRENYNF